MLPIGPFVLCSFGGVSTRLAVSALQCCVVGCTVGMNSASRKDERCSRGELAAVRHTSVRGNLTQARCLLRLRNLKRYHA